jgi:two-component system sporulation sensor kinase A
MINQDITLTKKHFYSVFHYSAIGMALVGQDGRWINVNSALCHFLGYPEHELTEITFQEMTFPEDLCRELEYMNQLITGEIVSYQREKRYIHKKGHVVWGLLTVSSVMDEENSPVRFITQIQDISERKRMEEELKKKEQLYQLISENAQDVIFSYTPDGLLEFVTPSVRTILGYRNEDILGLPLSEFYHPEDFIYLNSRTYAASDSFTFRFRHKDGHYVWLETTTRQIRNDIGELEKVIGISRDVTLRRQMETDLLSSEENLKQAQRIAGLGSWEWDMLNDSAAWSDELFRIAEIHPDQFTGSMRDFYNLIHPGDADKLQQAVADSVLGKNCDLDCRIITPKGTLKHLHLQG